MTAIYKRTLDGFVPANDDAAAFAGKVKLGKLITLEGKQSRNLRFHRKYFAILKLISENSNPHIGTKAALHFAKLASGTGEFVKDSRGESHFVPGSISFAKMDEDAFQAFVQSSIPPLVGRFMQGSQSDDVINEAMELSQ